MSESVVVVDKVSIRFNLSAQKFSGIKDYLIKIIKRQITFQEFWALQEISMDIYKGEVFGIVGLNGAGKSTLLKVIAGVLKPTIGTVKVKGTIAPLIELGAGFDMELTARENIYLNGVILGYTKKFINSKFDEMVDFAEISEFLDVPLKNFSSGMVARLAFAIATIVNPEILIADEILSVGDFKFKEKSENRIKQMIDNGTTVIIVSHSIEQIRSLCDRVAFIKKGKLLAVGETDQICDSYINES